MNVTIIGVPYNLDQHNRGMGAAPGVLLDAGLANRLKELGCETILAEMIEVENLTGMRRERIGAVMKQLAYEVARARVAGFFPLIIGGDCLTAVGAVAGLLDGANTGVAWFDAHGDFNTPDTSESQYLGGMPLACVAGRGLEDVREATRLTVPVPEENIVIFDARDLDVAEEAALRESAVTLLRGDALNDATLMDTAMQRLGSVQQLYLHVDVDILSPTYAPGVDFRTPDGMDLDTLRSLVGRVASLGNLAAFSLTAVNPEKDDGRTARAALDVIAAGIVPLSQAPT